MGYMLSKHLQSMVKTECCNDYAILELLQIIEFHTKRPSKVRGALQCCIEDIEEVLNTVDVPSMADPADFRRRERNDADAEAHFNTVNSMAARICGIGRSA